MQRASAHKRTLQWLRFVVRFEAISDFFERVAFSNRRARWTLHKCQKSCGERRRGFVRPPLFVDRELKIGKTRQACLVIENSQARGDCARGKRRNG
jgi:hypothetical protein